MNKKNKATATDNKSYHHGNLPDALISAAEDLLDSEGIEAVTLRAVARQAGVSQAAPYHHFKDKNSLLGAVARRGFEHLIEVMQARAEKHAPEEDNLTSYGIGYVEFSIDNPSAFSLMFGPAFDFETIDDPALIETASNAFHLLEQGLADHIGVPVSDTKEFKTATLTAWSLVHGLACLEQGERIDLSALSAEERLAQIRRVFSMVDFQAGFLQQ